MADCITGDFTATPGDPTVNPSTASIVNVTAAGTYVLWEASPGVMFGWGAPFHFAAKRIQIDSMAGKTFTLRGTSNCSGAFQGYDFHLDDALYLNVSTLIAGSQGANVGYGSLPTGINLTALLSVGIHSLSAYNILDSFWYTDKLLLVVEDECELGIIPPSASYPASGGSGTINVTDG